MAIGGLVKNPDGTINLVRRKYNHQAYLKRRENAYKLADTEFTDIQSALRKAGLSHII